MLSPRDAAAAVVRGVGRDGVRDDLRELLPGLAQDVLGQDVLAGDPRDGIGPGLAIDETADLRKGRSAGTQRQYTGTAGRTENAQVAVYRPMPPRRGARSPTRPCTCPGPGRPARAAPGTAGPSLPARLRVPGRPGRRPARRQPATCRPADLADLPRNPQTVHRTVPAAARPRCPAALVTMAPTTPSYGPGLPLPPTSPRTHMFTKSRWNIRLTSFSIEVASQDGRQGGELPPGAGKRR